MSSRRSTHAVTKLSVSLLPEHAAWLRARAKKDRRALSAVLGDAVAEAQRVEAQRELLEWLERGPAGRPTEAEIEAIRAEWREARRPRRRTA